MRIAAGDTCAATVEPREIRGLRRRQRDAGEPARHLFEQEIAIAFEIAHQLFEPRVGFAVSGDGRGVAEHIDLRHEVGDGGRESLAHGGVRNDCHRALEPGKIERLARRHERHRARLDLRRQRRDRHVAASVEQQITMDLIGDDPHVAARARRGHALELGAVEHPPNGIVRVAQQECPRARAERARERVEIHRVASVVAAPERVLVAGEPMVAGRAQDRRVHGGLHQQAFAGGRERAQRQVEAGDDARQGHDCLGAHAPAVALRHPLGDDLLQLRLLDEVAEEAVLDPCAQCLHDRGRGGKVHVRDPERQHVGREFPPLVAVRGAAIDHAVEVERHRAQD